MEDGKWPMLRWEEALVEPGRLWGEVVERVMEGRSLRQIARERGFPVLAFCGWVVGDGERSAEYERAREVAGEEMALEGMELLDGADAETLGVRKERAKYRQWMAASWARERYGVRETVVVTNPGMEVDRALGELAEMLMKKLHETNVRTIDLVPEDQESGS